MATAWLRYNIASGKKKGGKNYEYYIGIFNVVVLMLWQHPADTHLLNAAQDLHFLKKACFVETWA